VVAADTMGLPRKRVDEMLDLVSLTPTEAKRRVRHYSLGMRQRLGIATALLGDPRVLILDEPANGLDPAGIRWMRDLLTDFASQGGTVLLSSHLLHEIEVIADDLVVIGNGKIVAAGTKEELLAAAGTLARSTSPRDLAHALEKAGIPSTLAGDGSVRTDADPARVGSVALTAGIPLTELRSAEGTGLEDMFLSLTADTQREGVAA
jgi:ABC-2 type transport system ATP-binding protein